MDDRRPRTQAELDAMREAVIVAAERLVDGDPEPGQVDALRKAVDVHTKARGALLSEERQAFDHPDPTL